MARRLAALVAALAMIAGIFAFSGAPAEAAPKRCTGNKSSGVCYSVSKSKRHLQVMQSIPLQNKSKKKGTFHCSFSDTLTRSFTGGVKLTAGAKGTIMGVAEISSSIELSLSLTQSASRATSAAADVVLKPRQSVVCQRTYGYLKTKVTETHYSKSSVWTRQYWVSIPVYMGVRLVD